MATNLTTNFTERLTDTKSSLDSYFRIPLKREAVKIIKEMLRKNTDVKKSSLGDADTRLLEILNYDFQYITDHPDVQPDGTVKAKSLFGNNFENTRRNAMVIAHYAKYIKKFKTADELDGVFLEKMNSILSEYKSSEDYMRRIVVRLLKNSGEHTDDKLRETSVRVLILRKFLEQFGYDCVEAISTPELEKIVNEKFDGKIENIDDNIFSLISADKLQSDASGEAADSDRYINAVTKLQGTIKYKATLILMTEQMCQMLCEVMNEDVLSDKAKDRTASVLSECFSKPFSFIQLEDFKEYSDTEKLDTVEQLNELLQKRYQNGYLLHTDFSHAIRLYTLMKKYSDVLEFEEGKKADKMLCKLYPDAIEHIVDKVGRKIKISGRFNAEKIELCEIDEKYSKLTEKLESTLFKQGKDIKKEYSVAVGEMSEVMLGKKTGRPVCHFDFVPVIRLIVLLTEYAKYIPADSDAIVNLKNSLPGMSFVECDNPETVEDIIGEKLLTSVKGIRDIDNAAKNTDFMEAFASFAEQFVGDKKEYAKLLRDRVENRYNNATKKGGTDYISNRKKLYTDTGKQVYDYKLVKIADALAKADFSAHGKTREYLYIFAIAFGMTASGVKGDVWCKNGETGAIARRSDPRKITDIEKNLFVDYYADDIIRDLTENTSADKTKADFVVDGHGINYKNFAEIAFLWSAAQQQLTAAEKIKTAYDIIGSCRNKNRNEKAEQEPKINNMALTQAYKTAFSDTVLETADDVKAFLIEKYDCSDDVSVTKVSEENRTARNEMDAIEFIINELLAVVEDGMILHEDVVGEDELEQYRQEKYKELCTIFSENLGYFFRLEMYLKDNKCKKCKRRKEDMFPYCDEYFKPWTDGKQSIKSCEDYYTEYKNDLANSADEEKKFNDKMQKMASKLVSERAFFKSSFAQIEYLCGKDYPELKKLFRRIKNRVGTEGENEVHFKKASRTAIVALCYYLMILMNHTERLTGRCSGNFEDYFDMFCNGRKIVVKNITDDIDDYEGTDYDWNLLKGKSEFFNIKDLGQGYYEISFLGANELLQKCSYQKINSKNILDITMVFLAFKDSYKRIYHDQQALIENEYFAKMNGLAAREKELAEKEENEIDISEDR